MHQGTRLAVTAGATVLGLAALSGPVQADTGGDAPTSTPLADLVDGVTSALEGLAGTATEPEKASGQTSGGTEPAKAVRVETRSAPAKKARTTARTKAAPRKEKPKSDPDPEPARKGGSGSGGGKPSGHLKVEVEVDHDKKKRTVSGHLLVDAGLTTLLGDAGLRLQADGTLSAGGAGPKAADPAATGPKAEGGIRLDTTLGRTGATIATYGAIAATPNGVTASGSLDVCAGAGCGKAPGPGVPPDQPPPGGGPDPSPSPGLPDLPPSSPLLPTLPEPDFGDRAAVSPAALDVPGGGQGDKDGELPFTGAGSLPLAALGLAAVLAGGVGVATTRRRTPADG